MIQAYHECYLHDAQRMLAELSAIATVVYGIDFDMFSHVFVASGLAEMIEDGNPYAISGRSSVEAFMELRDEYFPGLEEREIKPGMETLPEYWAGWILAYLAWRTSLPFKRIFNVMSYQEIVMAYYPYHEADPEKFVEDFIERMADPRRPTALKRIREGCQMTQKELSEKSGVPLRAIQLYEQRQNDIDKAAFSTVNRLAKALYVEPADLMEGLP